MKTSKILYCASSDSHLVRFHMPYIRALSQSYAVFLLGNGPRSDYALPFSKHFFSLSNAKAFLKMRRILRRESFDAILTHTSMASFLLRLSLKGKKKRPAVLVTVHGYLFSKNPKGLREHILLLCEKLVRGQTDAIAVMNQEDHEIAQKYKLSRGPLFFLFGMGLPDVYGNVQSMDIRNRYSISKQELLLGYVGELSKRKNQIFLIRAVAKLREDGIPVRLFLVGEGAEKESLEQEARRIGMAPYIFFLGESDAVTSFLTSMDLYVSASRFEGLPFNLMEAMEAGLPILASAVKGQTDLLIEDPDSLYSPESMEEFCQKVKAIRKGKALGAGSCSYPNLSKYRLSEVFDQNMRIFEGWKTVWKE